MKAKLLVFITMLIFSSNVFAEYYLVYPAASLSCDQCYQTKHKKRHATYKKRPRTAVVYKKKRNTYSVRKFHAPCAGVVTCSACGEYAKTSCGRPDYFVYSAQSTDCLTYEGVLAGEEQ